MHMAHVCRIHEKNLCCIPEFPGRPLSKHLQLHSVSVVSQQGRTSAGFRHRQQWSKVADCWGAAKKSPHEGIHAHTCCQVAGEPQGGCYSPEGRGLYEAAAFPVSSRRESHLPLPSVVSKITSATPCRNFAPSVVGQFAF